MSIKRRIQYNVSQVANYFRGLELPTWLTSTTFKMICLSVFLFFSFAYILQTASTSANGYKINTLEKEVYAAQNDISNLQVQVAQNSSMTSIQSRLADTGMVAVSDLKFYASAAGEQLSFRTK